MKYISAMPPAAVLGKSPRSLAVLGSTGSIGGSAMSVVRQQKDKFKVVSLAGGRNIKALAEQAVEFRPDFLAVLEPGLIDGLKALLPDGYNPEILSGQEGYETLAAMPEADFVLSAQVGAAGLRGTLAAAGAGKAIALANKESLVLAGKMIRKLCAETGASILPVDSEHNAIFQCMNGENPAYVTRIILTASGGPFRGRTLDELKDVTLEQALKHPNWSMGAKITIDSATMMNKGLEIIEACHLYGLPQEKVDAVIHKESIIHSLVEFSDGSQLAHLGLPDMRIAIANCLGWPERIKTGVGFLDLVKAGQLTFEQPDEKAFPCLALARRALGMENGGTVWLNAANEIAVDAFLNKKIKYLQIAELAANALDYLEKNDHLALTQDNLENILEMDRAAREFALKSI